MIFMLIRISSVVHAAECLPLVQWEFLALPLALSCAVQRILSTAQVPPPRRSDVKSEEASKPPLGMHLQLCRAICLGRLAQRPRRIRNDSSGRTTKDVRPTSPNPTGEDHQNGKQQFAIHRDKVNLTQPTSTLGHLDLKQI